mmetsp:Transcript_18336/g.37649  ORF Transcript_18336/g.37649 Transcript_18336/m.37649 type:complete len:374 (+) Transcript_18336:76-1197(+)
MSLFSRRNVDGGVNYELALILVGFPLLLSGQLFWGVLSILLALVLAGSQGVTEADKIEIRFNALTPENLLDDLQKLAETDFDKAIGKKNTSRKTHLNDGETRIKYYVEGLSALGPKYSKSNDKDKLSLRYQQLAFKIIGLFPQNDQIIAGAISLLALIAKDPRVRKRFKYQTENYGLNIPIFVLKKVLERAKEENDEAKEELLAEILRKGCLFLGAMCNDDKDLGLSSVVVSEGGLELILEAAKWFRLHEDFSNWALWAVFTLSYDQRSVKAELVRLQGIQTICGLMENNPTSLEVNRHGTALLFDLLRENQNTDGITWDPWEVRRIALASGLHDRLLCAMNAFADSRDIIMMGQEMLIGTGFRGDIPKYEHI